MRKKEIERIPFGEQKVHIHKDTLLIDVVSEGKNARICIRKTEFANFVESKGWNKRMLGGGYYGYGPGLTASGLDLIKEDEVEVATEFIEKKLLIKSCYYWSRTQSLERKLEVAQDYINELKRQVKEKNRKKRIDDHLKAIKGPSDKLKKWAANQMPSYFFYRTKGKKSSGICPVCQETVTFVRKTAKIQHNQQGKCPACGKEIVFKAAVYDFNAEDPWAEAYGAVQDPEEEPKGEKEERKQESVATSQQEEETEPEEQIPGQKNIADYEGVVPETEPFDPSPEKIVSKCYDCLNWEKCSEKGEAVDYCLDYKNKNAQGAMSERELQEAHFMNQPETQTVDPAGEIRNRRIEHDIKISSIFFADSRDGIKPFELRKNDRNYNTGDILKMREYRDGEMTGNVIRKEITYVLEDFEGLMQGYCILGVKDV